MRCGSLRWACDPSCHTISEQIGPAFGHAALPDPALQKQHLPQHMDHQSKSTVGCRTTQNAVQEEHMGAHLHRPLKITKQSCSQLLLDGATAWLKPVKQKNQARPIKCAAYVNIYVFDSYSICDTHQGFESSPFLHTGTKGQRQVGFHVSLTHPSPLLTKLLLASDSLLHLLKCLKSATMEQQQSLVQGCAVHW